MTAAPVSEDLDDCLCLDKWTPDWVHTNKCPIAKALRQEWCTPKWLAELIGEVDLDPCSNKRSHIQAKFKLDGKGGLTGECIGEFWWVGPMGQATGFRALPGWRVFINPPYGPGSVEKWVRHYYDTNFIFLLRWDPSTKWFSELHHHSTHIWHPGERINFEPPPRIRASSNAYPHALFMRDPDQALLDRLAARGGYLNEV